MLSIDEQKAEKADILSDRLLYFIEGNPVMHSRKFANKDEAVRYMYENSEDYRQVVDLLGEEDALTLVDKNLTSMLRRRGLV